MTSEAKPTSPSAQAQTPHEPIKPKKRIYTCDVCGFQMQERECKVICQNCGNRFDCSDLNIYFD